MLLLWLYFLNCAKKCSWALGSILQTITHVSSLLAANGAAQVSKHLQDQFLAAMSETVNSACGAYVP